MPKTNNKTKTPDSANNTNQKLNNKVCPICNKDIFKSSRPNEGYYKVKVGTEIKETQIDINGVTYHKLCAKCSVCETLITVANYGNANPTMTCKDHVTRSHGGAIVNDNSDDPIYGSVDPSSNSNPLQVQCNNLYLDWVLDFLHKKITGVATYIVVLKTDDTESAIFDISDLIISKVYVNGANADYLVNENGANSAVTVKFPKSMQQVGIDIEISFVYSAGQNATAIQWLDAEATQSGTHPYVFTQSQAIHARSMFPCFDAPGVKVPYSARVSSPAWSTVLMSALAVKECPLPDSVTKLLPPIKDTSMKTFYWHQPLPVSSYLVAFAAGKLSSIDVSHRVRVWA